MGSSCENLDKKYICKACLITAVSRAAAKFIEHFAESKNIVIVPNGVNVERFSSVRKDTTYRLDDPIILYVGRLAYRKGLHVLIHAIPFILKEFPNARLLIAGKGYMDHFLRILIKSLHVEENVKLLGFIRDEKLPELYSLSSLFVLPSLYCESFGITLLEAMASGKPVVASNVGGIPEIVKNGVTGLLSRRGDPKDLADKIINVLSNQDLSQNLSFNAKNLVNKRFSWPIIAKNMEELYEKTLNNNFKNELST